MKLVSVVGFKNKSHPDALPVVRNLKSMGVRVSMLTGDDHHHAKMTANLLKIISIEEDIDHLHFKDMENGQIAIKEVLEKFKKLTTVKKRPLGSQNSLKHANTAVNQEELKSLNDSIIMFSGESWNVIRKSNYLLSHFLFICQFAKSIIGYNLSSLNKREFVTDFMNSNSGGTKNVIAVGDGFNDIGMLQAASVGIQLKSPLVDMVFGDIIVDNLAVIPLMMRRECRRLHSNLKQTIFVFFG